MRVLVTGGGGFIGCHLVESQLAQGHHVLAADLEVRDLLGWAKHPRLEVIEADISDPEAAQALVDGVDVVYHLASVHLDVTRSDEVYRRVNVEGTAHLVKAAAGAGVRRFVHCSSAGVFGDLPVPPPADERSPCHPTHIYEQSKLDGERAVLDFSRQTGFSVIVARPGWVYGPGCPRTVKLLRMVASGRFVIFGDGRTVRQPIYVTDVVRGLERCADPALAHGEVYILAGPTAVTITDLVRLVGDAQGVQPRIVYLPPALGHLAGHLLQAVCKPLKRQPPFSARSMDFFLKDNMYDTSKAAGDLGFVPSIRLEEGFKQTLAAVSEGVQRRPSAVAAVGTLALDVPGAHGPVVKR
jgi:nucleoside-diphosphate-sugar epimerase